MYDFPKLMWVENIEGTVQLYAHVIAWCQNSYLSFYHSKLARAEKKTKKHFALKPRSTTVLNTTEPKA